MSPLKTQDFPTIHNILFIIDPPPHPLTEILFFSIDVIPDDSELLEGGGVEGEEEVPRHTLLHEHGDVHFHPQPQQPATHLNNKRLN